MDDDLSNYQLFQNIESNGTDYEDVDRIGKKLYDKKMLQVEEQIDQAMLNQNKEPQDNDGRTSKIVTENSFVLPLAE